MAHPKRVNGLEIDEDPGLQHQQWQASRILWFVLVATMVATGLGAFGNGVITRAQAGGEGTPLWVDYYRVVRFGDSVRMTVHARPDADGTVRFAVGRPLLEAYRIQRITPQPSASAATGDGVAFEFHAAAAGAITVLFDLQPARRWGVGAELRSASARVRISQFVLP